MKKNITITLFWTCKDGSQHQLFEHFNTVLAAENYAKSVTNLSTFKIIDYEQIKRDSEAAEVEFFKSHPELNP